MPQNNFVTKDDLKTESKRLEGKMEAGFKKLEDKMETLIDQVIAATAKGFEETATKDDLKRVEGKVDKLEGKVDKLEVEVNKLEGKVDKLEVEVIYIKSGLNDLKTDTVSDSQFKNHEKRITRLENKIFSN